MKSVFYLFTSVIGLLILGFGWWFTSHQSQEADRKMRAEILAQATGLAMTINPELVKRLTFTEDDLEAPAYQRIRGQMMAYGRLIDQRGIYSMALREGQLLFGPENYAKDDPMGAGPPGTVYEEPGDEDFRIFETGRPIIQGPETDEYGTFISALAPVTDPVSGKILLVVGIDILATDWEESIIRSRIFPLSVTFFLLLSFLSGMVMIFLRNRLDKSQRFKYRHIETYIVGVAGILVTIILVRLVLGLEKRERTHFFNQKSAVNNGSIRGAYQTINQETDAIKSYFQSSRFVDSLEFATFTNPMLTDRVILCVGWSENGTDIHKPITYLNYLHDEPFASSFTGILTSNPDMKESTDRAIDSRLICGSVPFMNTQDSSGGYWMSVFLPVLTQTEVEEQSADSLQGIIVMMVDLQSLVNKSLSPSDSNDLVATELFDLSSGDDITLVAFSHPEHISTAWSNHSLGFLKKFSHIRITPLFMFGRTFAIISHPLPSFYPAYPFLATWITGVMGLLLTTILISFVGILRNRQFQLENTVRKRTSELRDRMEELTIAKDKAEASERLKTAFIQNISHEIRTPLNGILGFGDLILQPDISTTDKGKYFAVLQTNSARLLNTITNYVDISRLESQNMEVHLRRFFPADNLKSLLHFYKDACERKSLRLNLAISSSDERRAVETDPDLFAKILSHLLDNAVKFTGKGEITFGYTASNQWLHFFVRDTGIGIKQESLHRVFETFVQEEVFHTRGHEGSGLGLSIAKGMVQLLGGTMEIQSEKETGTCVTFSLPYQQDAKDQERKPDKSPHMEQASYLVLIAEDDLSNLQYVEALLRNYRIDFLTAATGQKAVDICRDHPGISLVLMDLKMPEMDGLEATKIIKSIRQDLPVIAITAYALTGDKQMALDAGCDDYIGKPFSREQLLNTIGKYLRIDPQPNGKYTKTSDGKE